jgi:molybdopterin converting factor subunit 1
MKVNVLFYSYFKDITGTPLVALDIPPGSTIGDLTAQLQTRFPRLKEMERSTLIAVRLEYQDKTFLLNDGDEVAFFPPVQGG